VSGLGDLLATSLSIAGAGALLATSATLFQVLKFVGAVIPDLDRL
jgi:homoserine/homoserine lactone efflux protein